MNDNMSPTGSRWNPTKEQMDLLENLYKQGIRTPSAEQIQQITMRLKAFGHIEGKNVFYWFQNHKARQRQKQKQDHIAYNFNRFLHRTCVFPPPCPKVVCSPYYAPQSDLGFYQQCSVPRLILPGPGLFIRRRAACDAPAVYMISTNDANNHCQENSGMVEQLSPNAKQYNTNNNQQTLNLFPLHPTGILQERTSTTSSSSSSSSHLSIKENF